MSARINHSKIGWKPYFPPAPSHLSIYSFPYYQPLLTTVVTVIQSQYSLTSRTPQNLVSNFHAVWFWLTSSVSYILCPGRLLPWEFPTPSKPILAVEPWRPLFSPLLQALMTTRLAHGPAISTETSLILPALSDISFSLSPNRQTHVTDNYSHPRLPIPEHRDHFLLWPSLQWVLSKFLSGWLAALFLGPEVQPEPCLPQHR